MFNGQVKAKSTNLRSLPADEKRALIEVQETCQAASVKQELTPEERSRSCFTRGAVAAEGDF